MILSSIKGLIFSFTKNKSLIFNLVKRDITSKYKGSMLGLLWAVFTPVFMLAVYTFVFSVVFNTKWGEGATGNKGEFALLLFSGLIIFNYFSEVVNRAPSLILSHSNYVKKVVFPLEVLPWVSALSALFNFFTSLLVWIVFYLYINGLPHITAIELPLILIPLVLLVLGISWFLSALGVYLRDIGQLIGIALTMVMFLSPIFYPLSALPIEYRSYLELNPIAPLIEAIRNIMYLGQSLNMIDYIFYTVYSFVIALLGFVFFQKTRKGFADVL
ncbi:ABC transporter permease [Photobacterium ganghwense]|uniref:ABC transporter permease n=1 Tax=Photobacterium ganghwense TaxID=320778 RepID=UPI0040574C33